MTPAPKRRWLVNGVLALLLAFIAYSAWHLLGEARKSAELDRERVRQRGQAEVLKQERIDDKMASKVIDHLVKTTSMGPEHFKVGFSARTGDGWTVWVDYVPATPDAYWVVELSPTGEIFSP